MGVREERGEERRGEEKKTKGKLTKQNCCSPVCGAFKVSPKYVLWPTSSFWVKWVRFSGHHQSSEFLQSLQSSR